MRKKFTTRFIETVTTTAVRSEYFDQQEDGLMLRVTRDGTKTFAFRYRRKSDGKRRYFTLGRFPDRTLEEARLLAVKARIAVAEGGDPASGIETRRTSPTFRLLVADWIAQHASISRSDSVRADDQSMLANYILPNIGDMKVHDIGRNEISAMIARAKVAKDGRKGHTKRGSEPRRLTHRPNRVFELTRAILRWAHSQGIIAVDPTSGLKRPIKTEAPRDRDLSSDEIGIFWRNVHQLPASPGLHIAMKLALVTAQRIGEVCGIAKSELHLEGPAPIWIIPNARTKNREGHRVPLSPLAGSLIREALALQGTTSKRSGLTVISPYLFPARAKRDRSHGPIKGGAASVALFRGREALGLENFRVHDLRRTAATRMAEIGVNPHTISLILNHVSASKSTVTSKVYVQYSYDKEKREALEAWSDKLEAIFQKVGSVRIRT